MVGESSNNIFIGADGGISAIASLIFLDDVVSADRNGPGAVSEVISADAEWGPFSTTPGVIGDRSVVGIPVLLEVAGGVGAHEYNTTTGKVAPATDPRTYKLDIFDEFGAQAIYFTADPLWCVITTTARTVGGIYTLRFFRLEYGSGSEIASAVGGTTITIEYAQGFLFNAVPYGAFRRRSAKLAKYAPSFVINHIDNTILVDMAQSLIKGRASGAGTGDPQDLTATQVRTLINVEDGADVTDEASVLAALAASIAAKDLGGGNIENTGLDDGGVLFVDANGDIISDIFKFLFNNTTKRLSLGGGSSPVSVIDLRAANPGVVGGAQAGMITMHSTATGTAAIAGISGHRSGANQLWYLGSLNASSHIVELRNKENAELILSTNNTFRMIIQSGGNVQFLFGVGIGIADPVASARLQVESTTQGFLPPRMTTAQRDAIGSPATGLVVFNTTTGSLDLFDGSVWVSLRDLITDTTPQLGGNLDTNGNTINTVTTTAVGGGSAAALRAVSTSPAVEIRETDAALDEKSWDVRGDSGALLFRAVNDANSASATWMQVERTGITIDSVVFPNGNVGIGTTGAPDRELDIRGTAQVITPTLTDNGIKVVGDSLTTGSLMLLSSNSVSTSTRNLVDIINDNPAATGAVSLRIQQDSTGDIFQAFDGATQVFSIEDGGMVGIANGAGNSAQYRLDVGGTSYFAVNGDFAHIVQHNSAASTFWSIAPRNGGDLDIAVTTTDPRPTGATIDASDNVLSITPDGDVTIAGTVTAANLTAHALIEERGISPNRTTTSATFVTLESSAATTFSGRPVLCFVIVTMFPTVGNTAVELAIQIDAGADAVAGQLLLVETEQNTVVGMALVTPAAGSRTLRVRWRRTGGTGTLTLDANDQILLHAVEL